MAPLLCDFNGYFQVHLMESAAIKITKAAVMKFNKRDNKIVM